MKLKNVLCYILVLIYALSLYQPVMPYLEYYLNKGYIAQFLCINKDKPELKCNGKCHLKKQLANANKEKPGTATSQKPNTELKIDIKAFSNISEQNSIRDFNKRTIYTSYNFICKEYQSEIPSPPPKPSC